MRPPPEHPGSSEGLKVHREPSCSSTLVPPTLLATYELSQHEHQD